MNTFTVAHFPADLRFTCAADLNEVNASSPNPSRVNFDVENQWQTRDKSTLAMGQQSTIITDVDGSDSSPCSTSIRMWDDRHGRLFLHQFFHRCTPANKEFFWADSILIKTKEDHPPRRNSSHRRSPLLKRWREDQHRQERWEMDQLKRKTHLGFHWSRSNEIQIKTKIKINSSFICTDFLLCCWSSASINSFEICSTNVWSLISHTHNRFFMGA